MLVFFGVFFADFQNYAPAVAWGNARRWTSTVLGPLLILLGLCLASYPEGDPNLASWSRFQYKIGTYVFNENQDFPRFYTAFGAQSICFGIHFCPGLREVLSNRYFLWLGKLSFAVYLIHGTLLRTLLATMLWGIGSPPEGEHLHTSKLRFCFWYPIWMAVLYICADSWVKHVDPFCGRLTQRLWEYAVGETVQVNQNEQSLPV